MESGQAAGWMPDPMGRHAQRYWDGTNWTDAVADGEGNQASDPVSGPALTEAVPAQVATPHATAVPPAPRKRGKRLLLIALVAIIAIGAGIAGAVVASGGDDDPETVAAEDQDDETTTTEEETTTTEEPEETTTSTTEAEVLDPADVVGSSIASALGNLREAGIVVQQVEVIDESVPDGQVTQAVAQPDGSVVLTVARPPVTRFLETIAPVDASRGVGGPSFNISGTTYTHGVTALGCDGAGDFFEYDLGRDFRRLVATGGLLDTEESDARARLEISLDGEIVSTQDLGLADTVAIDLDVTGRLRVRFNITMLSNNGNCPRLGFGDARLLGVPSEVPPVTPGG